MKPFKRPLIITGIAFAVALLVGIVGVTLIHNAELSNRKKQERAQMLGAGVGITTCVVVAPFWLFAAAKVGKARREQKGDR